MSYGMPKSYDSWRTQGPPETDHHTDCPCHDDAEPICKCKCPDKDHNDAGICRDEKRCLCEGWTHDEDPDCICADFDGGDK